MAEKLTVARPYAQALFSLADEHHEIENWSGLLTLLTRILESGEILGLLANPRVDNRQVVEVITAVVGDSLSQHGRGFIETLVGSRRLELLPEIRALFEIERARVEGIIDAEITSAIPLTAEQKSSFETALKRRLGREVNLRCKVDEAVIGGAIIRAHDMVIDGTVAGKLEQLGRHLGI